MDYVGQLLDLPTWVKNLSPFKWIPRLPVDKMHWQFAWVMLIFAITFIGLSLVIYRKRYLMREVRRFALIKPVFLQYQSSRLLFKSLLLFCLIPYLLGIFPKKYGITDDLNSYFS